MPDNNDITSFEAASRRLKGELKKTFERAVQKRVMSKPLRDALERREQAILKHFGEKRLNEIKDYRADYPKRLAAEIKRLSLEQFRKRPELRPAYAPGNALGGRELHEKARQNIHESHQATLDTLTRNETSSLNELYDGFFKPQDRKGEMKKAFGRVVDLGKARARLRPDIRAGPTRSRD